MHVRGLRSVHYTVYIVHEIESQTIFLCRRKRANTLNNFLLAGDLMPDSASERLGLLSLELTMNSYVDIL